MKDYSFTHTKSVDVWILIRKSHALIHHLSSSMDGHDSSHHHTEKKAMKNPRFAFRTKSDEDILDDGYRWKKYGQKSVKNSLYPR